MDNGIVIEVSCVHPEIAVFEIIETLNSKLYILIVSGILILLICLLLKFEISMLLSLFILYMIPSISTVMSLFTILYICFIILRFSSEDFHFECILQEHYRMSFHLYSSFILI